jgi:outer membrane protein OmpA-like peptidoglycan-associated protein
MESTPRIVIRPEVSASGPTPPAAPRKVPNEGGGRVLPLLLLGAVALLSVGAIGYAIGERGSSDNDEAIELDSLNEAAASTTSTQQDLTTTALPETAAPTTTTQSNPEPTTTTPTSDPAELEGPPLRDTGTVRQAVLSNGVLYLRGSVPSEEFGAEIARRAELVVGAGNVVNQYAVDATAAPVDSAPLYVADTLLFPTGGTQINPGFLPLLDLGTTLLNVNENVTITVVAHTDSAGTAAQNLRLSQLRADVVRQYWIDQGVEGTRITAEGRGEAEPIADNNTLEGRLQNRRAEFIVIGILG